MKGGVKMFKKLKEYIEKMYKLAKASKYILDVLKFLAEIFS